MKWIKDHAFFVRNCAIIIVAVVAIAITLHSVRQNAADRARFESARKAYEAEKKKYEQMLGAERARIEAAETETARIREARAVEVKGLSGQLTGAQAIVTRTAAELKAQNVSLAESLEEHARKDIKIGGLETVIASSGMGEYLRRDQGGIVPPDSLIGGFLREISIVESQRDGFRRMWTAAEQLRRDCDEALRLCRIVGKGKRPFAVGPFAGVTQTGAVAVGIGITWAIIRI